MTSKTASMDVAGNDLSFDGMAAARFKP